MITALWMLGIVEQSKDQEFWSDVYRGRPIAILNRSGRRHIYLDHVLQHNIIFATAEHALEWLTARIDLGVFGRRHWRADHEEGRMHDVVRERRTSVMMTTGLGL